MGSIHQNQIAEESWQNGYCTSLENWRPQGLGGSNPSLSAYLTFWAKTPILSSHFPTNAGSSKGVAMKYSIVSRAMIAFVLATIAGCSSPDPAETMKPLNETYVAVWNGADPSALDGIVDVNFVRHLNSVSTASLDSLKSRIAMIRATYPDFTVAINGQMYMKEGSVARFTFTGTHSGRGAASLAGKKIRVSGQSMIRVADGKIAEEWVTTEDLTLLTQLGYTITPPAKPREAAKKGSTPSKKGATAVKSSKTTATKKPAAAKTTKKAPAKKATTKKN